MVRFGEKGWWLALLDIKGKDVKSSKEVDIPPWNTAITSV
jgi:hypothetical protein